MRDFRALTAQIKEKTPSIKAFVGFDGFIDRIANIVATRQDPSTYKAMPGIAEFGARITAMAGLSGGLEVVTKEERLGGNAPLMANALGGAGIETFLAAAMGDPMHNAFTRLDSHVTPVSTGGYGSTLALEFDDGKVLLGEISPLTALSPDLFLRDPAIIPAMLSSNIIAMVNWAEIAHANAIWEYALEKILPNAQDIPEKFVFFDLSDFGSRTKEDIDQMTEVFRKDHGIRKILGLNLNEATEMCAHLGIQETGLEAMCAAVAKKLKITIVIHDLEGSAYSDGNTQVFCKGYRVAKPVTSTGAGDHFNGGFCVALASGLAPEEALLYAMGTSGAYVALGHTPTVDDVCMFLETHYKRLET